MTDDAEHRRVHAAQMQAQRAAEAACVRREKAATAERIRRESWARQDVKEDLRRADRNMSTAERVVEAEKRRLHSEQLNDRRLSFSEDMYEQRRTDQLADREAQDVRSLDAEKERTSRALQQPEADARGYGRKLDHDYRHDLRTRPIDRKQYDENTNTDTESYERRLRADDRNMRSEVKTRLRALIIEKISDHILSKKMIEFTRGIDNRIESQSIEEIADKLDALDAAHDRHERQSLSVEHELQLRNITKQED